jgi:hypothetical protein
MLFFIGACPWNHHHGGIKQMSKLGAHVKRCWGGDLIFTRGQSHVKMVLGCRTIFYSSTEYRCVYIVRVCII